MVNNSIQIKSEPIEFDFNSNQPEASRNASNYSSQVILPLIQMADTADNGNRETKNDHISKVNFSLSKVSYKQKLSKTQIQIRNHLIKRKYNKYSLTQKSSIKSKEIIKRKKKSLEK